MSSLKVHRRCCSLLLRKCNCFPFWIGPSHPPPRTHINTRPRITTSRPLARTPPFAITWTSPSTIRRDHCGRTYLMAISMLALCYRWHLCPFSSTICTRYAMLLLARVNLSLSSLGPVTPDIDERVEKAGQLAILGPQCHHHQRRGKAPLFQRPESYHK